MSILSGTPTRTGRVATGGARLIDAAGETLTVAVRSGDDWANTRMIHHFYTRFVPSLSTEKAAEVAIRLRNAANDTDEMRRIVSEVAGETNAQIAKAAEEAFKVADDMGDIATSSLEMMIKRSVGGEVLGFKSAAEMQAGYRRFLDDMKDVLPASELTPEGFIRHLRLDASIDGLRILEPQLDLTYNHWVARRVRKAVGELTDADRAAYPPTDYMRITRRSNRLRAYSDSMLGPVMKPVRRMISGVVKAGKGWAFFPRAVRKEADVLASLLGAGWAGMSKAKRLSGVRSALATDIAADFGKWQGKLDAAWRARYGEPIPPVVAQWVNNCLLNAIDPSKVGKTAADELTGLTGDHLKKVMGDQIIDLDEFAHRMIDAHEIVEDIGEAMVFRQAGDVSARSAARETAAASAGVYQGIPGQFDQVIKVVTRSSNGAHGYVHEVVTSIFRLETWVSKAPGRSLVAGLRVLNSRKVLAEGFDLLRREGRKLWPEELKAVDDVVPYMGRLESNGKIASLGSIYEQLGAKFRGVLEGTGGEFTENGLPEVHYKSDAGQDVVDELQLEAYATFSQSRAGHGLSYTDMDIADQLAQVEGDMARGAAACDATNALFANKSPLTNAVRDEILDTATETLRSTLEPIFKSADPPLTVAEAMWLRILVYPKEGVVTEKVLGWARTLAGHSDNLTLRPGFLQGDDVIPQVGVGWWLDPKNLENVGKPRQ